MKRNKDQQKEKCIGENYKMSKERNEKNWSKRATETLTKLNTEKEISDKN